MLALVCTSSPLASRLTEAVDHPARQRARIVGPRTPDCRIANSSPPSRAIAPASSTQLCSRAARGQQIAAGQAERVVPA